MSREMEALCLRLLDLARGQKAALEAGNLDEVLSLAGARQQVLQDIQKFDRSPPASEPGENPSIPVSVIRQVLSIDEEAGGIVREQMRVASDKINDINTLNVFCQGIVDEARLRGGISGP